MKIDWYLLFAWLTFIIGALIIYNYYTINVINECTSDPISYSEKVITKDVGMNMTCSCSPTINIELESTSKTYSNLSISEQP